MNNSYKRLACYLCTIIGVLFLISTKVECLQLDFLERAFFFKDITHFAGKPFPSPNFSENHKFTQTFFPSCDRLNRVIIPFSFNSKQTSSKITFNLYKTANIKPIYSTEIYLSQWSNPSKMGTHHLKGFFQHLWVPLQTESKNIEFTWELISKKGDNLSGVSIYLTKKGHPQLQPIKLEKGIIGDSYGAFYAYCQFSFNEHNIFYPIKERLERQKGFLFFYTIILLSFGIAILCTRDP